MCRRGVSPVMISVSGPMLTGEGGISLLIEFGGVGVSALCRGHWTREETSSRFDGVFNVLGGGACTS